MRRLILSLSILFAQTTFAAGISGQITVNGVAQEFSFNEMLKISDGVQPEILGSLNGSVCIVQKVPQLEGAWIAGCPVQDGVLMVTIIPKEKMGPSALERFITSKPECKDATAIVNVIKDDQAFDENAFQCEKLEITQ